MNGLIIHEHTEIVRLSNYYCEVKKTSLSLHTHTKLTT